MPSSAELTSARAVRDIDLEVIEAVRETADASTIVFAGGGRSLRWKPGQFLTVRVPDGQEWIARCYSLCTSPDTDEPPAITVKRIPGGRGSTWMVESLAVGDVIRALVPAGRFTPGDLDSDLLLLGGGSGITPLMSIMKSVLHAGTATVTLFYANRGENDVIFARELTELARQHPDRLVIHHWLDSVQGCPDPQRVARVLAPYADREVFLCGPGRFMDTARSALGTLGVSPKQVHVEQFSSLTTDPFTGAPADVVAHAGEHTATVEVTLDGRQHTMAWPRSVNLVDLLLSAGVDVPYSCRAGECGSCAATLISGEVSMENTVALDESDIARDISSAAAPTRRPRKSA
ncbi:ferredoxin--NADP reductase [Nocardia nova]|uniref:ferredoxin--NADP reductase n=1 Tax=Nocardia nova TaxID=37330 RepID=UPI002157D651|nr:ferredoxin--NADP reductase [Nocardia nova]